MASWVGLPEQNFNPRSPHGERRPNGATPAMPLIFQSTLPAWGATKAGWYLDKLVKISIHAPRMGSDDVAESARMDLIDFNPRSPHGERLANGL